MRLTTSGSVSPLKAHSSEMMTIFGWVLRAHSRAKCEGPLPMSLIKYQYLIAEALSVSMFPISWEYTLEAVSNPNVVWRNLCLMLPSRVAGTTHILVMMLFWTKYSVNLAPSVNVRVAPTSTKPVIPSLLQDSATIGNYSAASISNDLPK